MVEMLYTVHTSLGVFLDDLTTKACENCDEKLTGIAFKLTYHSKDNNRGLFGRILKVPPKLVFGLPTQFSCPVDLFMFLNRSLQAEGLSYKSTCMDLHLGSFPFCNIQSVVYIFETCKLKRYCSNIDFTNLASIVIWGYLPPKFSVIRIGYFMNCIIQ